MYGIFFVFAYGYFNRYERYGPYFMGMGMLLWVLPGVVFLVNSKQLELRQRRAAVYALIVAVLQGMAAAALFFANFFFTPISPIPVVMSALWVAAMVQLVVHLRRSLPLLEIDAERRHGFDVSVTPALEKRVTPRSEGSGGNSPAGPS